MKYTNSLNLKKPDQTDFYNVDDFNANADILDVQISNIKSGYLPLTGGTVTGTITAGTDVSLRRTVNNAYVSVRGGTNYNTGASVNLFGLEHATAPGRLELVVPVDSETRLNMSLRPNGQAVWDGKNLVRSVNGANADNAGNVTLPTISVANGGTGATTAAAARNNLGLGNTTGALPIANGGTGATTAAAARNNLGLGNTTGALPIANGGTGATDGAQALKNLGLINNSGHLVLPNNAELWVE